jgi:hypothetical protein
MMQYVQVKLKPHFQWKNWNSTKGRLFSPKHWSETEEAIEVLHLERSFL